MISERHRRFVEELTGASVVAASRVGSGGSRWTHLVELTAAAGCSTVVLRVEGDGAFTGTEVDLGREAMFYRALAGSGVPMARLLGVSPEGDALVLEHLAGSDILSDRTEPEQEAILGELARALATLHRLDPSSLDLGEIPVPVTAVDHARLDLAMWRRLADAHAPDREPFARWVEGWLWEHAPTTVEVTSLVQGDTGPGNLLAEGPVLTGLVDWEMAHVGDPMDDLAWVRFRCDGLTVDVGNFLADYAAASGITVDHDRLAYYDVVVAYRCYVISAMTAARGGGARGYAPYLLVAQRFLDQMADALMAVVPVDVVEVESVMSPPTPRTAWYDRLVETVRSGARAIDDPELADELRNAQILLHVLRTQDSDGARLDAAEAADAAASVRCAPDDPVLGDAMEGAGRVEDTEALAYLMRRRDRDRQRWKTIRERERTRR